MTTKQILVGIGAGAATTVLYVSVATGNALSIVLFYLAALPIFLACFGWGIIAGAVAALTAALAAVAIMGVAGANMVLFTAGLPAVWLSHLALLSRPDPGQGADGGNPGESRLQWYPLGRLVVWIAAIASVLTTVTMLIIAPDAETFQKSVRETLRQMIAQSAPSGALKDLQPEMLDQFIALLSWMLPAASAVIYMAATMMNMWLAAKITRASGLLRRSADAIGEMSYPHGFVYALAGALLVAMLPGTFGMIGGIASTAIIFAFALLGLVVLHVITRNMPARAGLLFGAYALLFLFNWMAALIFAGLGLAETFLSLRKRYAGRPGPPLAS